MANLFKHIEELDRVFWDIEEAEGEMTESLAARLSIAEEDFADKLDAYALYIKSLKGQDEVLKDEIATLSARREANNNKAERLKEALKFAVEKFGEVKKNGKHAFKTSGHSFWTQDSKSVQVEDDFDNQDFISHDIKFNIEDNDDYHAMLDVLADNDLDFTTNPKIDKKAIKEALDSDIEIEGAEIVTKTGIRIR